MDLFLEFSCFFYVPVDVGNLISGSSAFSKSSLYIWKFLIQVLLKPSLRDLGYNLASMWNKHNWAVVWASLALTFFGIVMKTDLFQSCGHCWVLKLCWHTECSTLTASSFRIWNNSARISLHPLALLVVMLAKAHLSSYSRMSGSRRVTTALWSSRPLRLGLCSFFVLQDVWL